MFGAGREHSLCPKCLNMCWYLAYVNSLAGSSRTFLCEMCIFFKFHCMTLWDLHFRLLAGIEKYSQVRMQISNSHVNKFIFTLF